MKGECFLRSDVADDYSDHHYVKKDVGNSFTNCSSFAYKRILKEWKSLEEGLPESITVHVYEQRIDLMRAMIVGTAGTPYHDALFLFDINFPDNYPFRPPNLFYHSFGYRLNPNLYRSGKICFDLLNTQSAKITDDWSPASTVCHLLLWIQAVVLNEKPHHNEPGHDGWLGQTLLGSQARSYNEDVFVMSCRTMLCLLRKPPKGFEQFIIRHFRDRGDTILQACTAYAKGLTIIGYYNYGTDSSDIEIKVSDKFKASITTLYPQLFRAFARIGDAQSGDCDKQLSVVKREPDLSTYPPKAKGCFLGIDKKITGELKKIFGFKKKKKNAK